MTGQPKLARRNIWKLCGAGAGSLIPAVREARIDIQDEFLRLQGLLQKTIVFITHDFDEAIRLTDRISIMKDGGIIQVATPEELVLNPATDYVREFTRHIPRVKVVSVATVMVKSASGTGEGIVAGLEMANV